MRLLEFVSPGLLCALLEQLIVTVTTRQFKPLPRIFTLYSWLSVEIAIINKESFKEFLDPDDDPDRHQNVAVQNPFPHPSKKHSSKSIRNFLSNLVDRLRQTRKHTEVKTTSFWQR